MSDPLLPQGDGATPLTDEERQGLKLSYVTTRGDLNAAEQQNILKAQKWAEGRKNNILHREYLNDLQELLDNVTFWIEHKTYPPDEIAARFHHKLVYIHPYPNGNCRHARLAADVLLREMGQEPFTWGRKNMRDAEDARKTYINALRAADGHDIGPLMEFVRS